MAPVHVPILVWVLFNVFVLAMLALDLGVFHRKAHVVGFRESIAMSVFWILLALLFAGLVHWWMGPRAALDFITGYLIEKSLSVDNLFVFLLIFRYFRVPRHYQHTVLSWGVIGALVMRAGFIAAGVALIHNFGWIVYAFGALLVYSGVQLFFQKGAGEVHPEHNPVLKLFRKLLPVTKDYEDGKFLVTREARRWATPLLLVLIMVETTDVLFATDSIPAILAITTDGFIVYTSNVFAILGLRAIFFALAGLMEMFHYLHYGLAVILVFVGGKMLASHYIEIHTGIALAVVGGVLALSVLASVVFPVKKEEVVPED